MRLRGGAAAAVVLVFAVAGCKAETTTGAGGPEETGGAAGSGAALTAAESLTVKGRAPKTGYARDRFGTAWADTDSNDCDTLVVSVLHRVAQMFVHLKSGVVSCAY